MLFSVRKEQSPAETEQAASKESEEPLLTNQKEGNETREGPDDHDTADFPVYKPASDETEHATFSARHTAGDSGRKDKRNGKENCKSDMEIWPNEDESVTDQSIAEKCGSDMRQHLACPVKTSELKGNVRGTAAQKSYENDLPRFVTEGRIYTESDEVNAYDDEERTATPVESSNEGWGRWLHNSPRRQMPQKLGKRLRRRQGDQNLRQMQDQYRAKCAAYSGTTNDGLKESVSRTFAEGTRRLRPVN